MNLTLSSIRFYTTSWDLTGGCASCSWKRCRLRYQPLHVAGRLARSGRPSILRLDARWAWAAEPATAFGRLRALPLTT